MNWDLLILLPTILTPICLLIGLFRDGVTYKSVHNNNKEDENNEC